MRALALLPLLLIACSGGEDTDAEPGPFTATLGTTECESSRALITTDDHVGTWLTSKVDIPGYPARIDQLTYTFDGRDTCSFVPPSLIRLSVGGATPATEPNFVYAQPIDPADDGEGDIITYTLDITDVTLLDGEQVYVHAQMNGDGLLHRCAMLCEDTDRSDEIWWSGASEVPFSYTAISGTGQSGQTVLSVTGEVLASSEAE